MKKYKKYKDVNFISFKIMPLCWDVRKIKDLFYISKDKTTKVNPTILSLARDSVKVRDITTNKGQLAADYSKYNSVKKGDLLLNPMDLYSGANCNVSNVEGVISPAYINLRKKANVNSKYYDYFFKNEYIKLALQSVGKGVSMDNRWTVSNNSILNYWVPVPSLEEQDKIADFLDWKINEIDKLIKIEEEKIEEIKKYRDVQISNNFKIYPYEKIKLKFLVNEKLKYGLNQSGKIKGKYRYIRITDIKKDGSLKKDNIVYVDLNDKSYLLDKYDLLFARSGTAGKAFIFKNDEKCAFAGYLIRARVSDHTLAKYIYYYTLTDDYKAWKDSIFIKSVIQNISAEKYKNLGIPFLDKAKQKEVVEKNDSTISKCKSIIKNIKKKIEELEKLKQSLISEVVTGQIDVRDIKIPEVNKNDLVEEDDIVKLSDESIEKEEN